MYVEQPKTSQRRQALIWNWNYNWKSAWTSRQLPPVGSLAGPIALTVALAGWYCRSRHKADSFKFYPFISGVFIKLAGIDIGSRSLEFVLLEDEQYEIIDRFQAETSIDLSSQLRLIKERFAWDHLISTGYGRQLSQKVLGGQVITEIKAYATAAHHLHPDIETVIDLGGQDTKALLINRNNGQLLKFEMNDKCSAGTGKFFEMMAGSLGLTLNELVSAALQGSKSVVINSTCTVFAESEVISLLTSGIALVDIARAVHEALLAKVVSLLSRVLRHDSAEVLFVGGGAKNSALVQFLSEAIDRQVLVPEYPDFYGAYGAAIHAGNITKNREENS